MYNLRAPSFIAQLTTCQPPSLVLAVPNNRKEKDSPIHQPPSRCFGCADTLVAAAYHRRRRNAAYHEKIEEHREERDWVRNP